MIHKTTDKVWEDHQGKNVPVEYIPDIDRRTEVTVGKLLRSAESLSKKLAEFKEKAYNEADKLYSEMLKNANIEKSERKGNYTLSSFDKSVKIEMNISETIKVNDNISFAQIKFNEFIALKTKGIDADISEIVNNAFRPRRNGRLDIKSLMDLFRYKITHPVWLEGIELTKKGLYTDGSVRYMTIWVKDVNGKYQPVKLNFSSI